VEHLRAGIKNLRAELETLSEERKELEVSFDVLLMMMKSRESAAEDVFESSVINEDKSEVRTLPHKTADFKTVHVPSFFVSL